MKKYIKICLIVIIALISLITIKAASKIIINNRFIAHYPDDNQEYRLILISLLNYYEPYIAPYNYGNYLYKKEMYEDASIKYRKALTYEIPKERICSIEINLGLSLIKESELIKAEEKDKAISLLEEAKQELQKCIKLDLTTDRENKETNKKKTEEQEKAEDIEKEVDDEIKDITNESENEGMDEEGGKNGKPGGNGSDNSSGISLNDNVSSKINQIKDNIKVGGGGSGPSILVEDDYTLPSDTLDEINHYGGNYAHYKRYCHACY